MGTPEYMPPEVIHGKSTKGTISDMWSLGVVVFQMLCGSLPFKGGSEYLTMKKVIKNDVQFPEDIDPDARDLIEGLLQNETTLRYVHAPPRSGLLVRLFFESM